jgi:hypothetical protein
VASVTGDKNGATVKALKEGAVKITVTANTSDGSIKDDYIFNSVTDISDVAAVTNGSAQLMRGCTSDSLSRDTVSAGFKFTITGKCGSYYFGKLPPDYQKPDNLGDYVFILKSKLNIPITKISVAANSNSLTVGASNKLKYTFEPSIANMHQYVDWSSDNTNVATVDANGNITTHLPGTVTFTGKVHGTNIKATKTLNATLPTTKVTYTSVHFKELYLKWNKVNGATGYYVYRCTGKNKYYNRIGDVKSKNIIAYTDAKVSDGTSYKYIVRPYVIYKGITRIAAYSNTLNLKADKIVLNAKTNSKISLKWGKIAGVSGYQVRYRLGKAKKYRDAKTSLKYWAGGFKTGTYYKCSVRPYKKNKGKKTTYYSWSKELKVGTYGKTNGYFADQIKFNEAKKSKPKWPGVAMTYAPASTSAMNNYKIKDSINNGTFKSPIKYNYSTKNKTLYIHVYVKFSGAGVNQKFEYYNAKHRSNGSIYYVKDVKQSKKSKYTYKALAKAGIKKYWTLPKVYGNKNDFVKGIKFSTKVVIHETNGKLDYLSKYNGQSYIPIIIGDMSVNGMANGDPKLGYWSFVDGSNIGLYKWRINSRTYGMSYYYSNPELVMHLATQYQTVVKNKGKYYYSAETFKDYISIAGHEFGHLFGLMDAYNDPNTGMIRVTRVSEVGKIVKKDPDHKEGILNIMVNQRKAYANGNDIEMILQAQGMAINDEPYSYQAYKTFTVKKYEDGKLYYLRYQKSKAIAQ